MSSIEKRIVIPGFPKPIPIYRAIKLPSSAIHFLFMIKKVDITGKIQRRGCSGLGFPF